jgi:hypothetical protein
VHNDTRVRCHMADTRGRARTAERILRSDIEMSPELRRALARLADRIACDLAAIDRDQAMAS